MRSDADRIAIDLDCDSGCVSISGNQMNSVNIDGQIEASRASLIAQLLFPQIKELMRLSKSELMRRNLDLMTSDD